MNIKTRILFGVLLLEVAGCAALLWYNYSSSKVALESIRENQIETIMSENRHRIDSLTQLMEKKVVELARVGEHFYELHQQSQSLSIDSFIIEYLKGSFKNFPESIGGGLWYEPYVFDEKLKYYGPYVFWNAKKELEFTWDLSNETYNYPDQSWYLIALPKNLSRLKGADQSIYWTDPYIDEAGSKELMMTVDAFMYSQKGEIIGLSTVDWSLKEMTEFIRKIHLTDSTHTFLIDERTQTLLHNTLDSASVLKSVTEISWLSNIDIQIHSSDEAKQFKSLVVGTTSYRLYLTKSKSNLILGMLIPESDLVAEINAITKDSLLNSLVIVLALVVGMLILLEVLFKPFERVRDLIQNSLVLDSEQKLNVNHIEYQEKNEFTPIIKTLNIIYEEIREFTRRIQEANKAKSTFLATMSHEIRTPMNAILGYTQLLSLDKSLTQEHREAITAINNSGNHLLDLLNDILDISKIESGAMELYQENLYVSELFSNLDSIFKLRCIQKNIEWKYVCSVPSSTIAFMDKAKLVQIMINLIGNSVKFTQRGQVALQVGMKNNVLCIKVSDTGPGISQEQQKKLFEPFFQGEAGNRQGGTGLGLAIVNKLIALMNGKLEIQSVLGEGTVFTLCIPLLEYNQEFVAPTKQTIEVEDFTPLQLKALVIDDVKINCDILVKTLQKLGVSSKQAENGLEALEILEGYHPDIIFVDIQMPIMDGYEFMEKINEQYSELAESCVAISANVYEQNRQELKSRFAHYVSKPFKLSEVSAVIAEMHVKK
jgi:signal transduction histidine kinase/CheY-like chemotaxis protein